MGMGPFDLGGSAFLALYAGLFVLTLIAGIMIASWLRPDGRNQRLTDAELLAYLAGGVVRFSDAVVTRLLATGTLELDGRKGFRIHRSHLPLTQAERSVTGLSTPAKWRDVARTLGRQGNTLDERLVAMGLLMAKDDRMRMRLWSASPWLVLFVFGAIKWEVGTLRDRPVGFLTVFLFVTAAAGVIRFARLDRRTRAGQAAVADAQERHDRIRRAPTTDDMGMAVALFGTTVLSGSAFAGYHQQRIANSGDGGGFGDGGSDGGGSGCGGGGCGGCGG